ncbi:MAG: SelL-related redox protein [Chloroflexota bacterium]
MKPLIQLKFNDPAPDAELLTINAERIRLADLWAQNTLLLSFTRHFGCPQCKEMLDILLEAQPGLNQRGLKLAAVMHASPAEAKAFAAERAPGLLCLADPERKAYRLYGLGRGTMRQTLLSTSVWRSNRRLWLAKRYASQLPPPGQDAFQMSGVFIIGTDGRVRLPYYYDHIADHPTADLLLHGVMGVNWNKPFEGPIALD